MFPVYVCDWRSSSWILSAQAFQECLHKRSLQCLTWKMLLEDARKLESHFKTWKHYSSGWSSTKRLLKTVYSSPASSFVIDDENKHCNNKVSRTGPLKKKEELMRAKTRGIWRRLQNVNQERKHKKLSRITFRFGSTRAFVGDSSCFLLSDLCRNSLQRCHVFLLVFLLVFRQEPL